MSFTLQHFQPTFSWLSSNIWMRTSTALFCRWFAANGRGASPCRFQPWQSCICDSHYVALGKALLEYAVLSARLL